MKNLNEIFQIHVTADKLIASINVRDIPESELTEIQLTKEMIVQFLQQQKIQFGIRYDSIEQLIETFPHTDFPIIVAEGIEKKDGKPGEIEYHFDMSTKVERKENWDFRDVMRIPTVKEGQKLATIIPPTKGEDGTTVYGTKIKARPGKPALLRPGKNVTYKENEGAVYADVNGQVSIIDNRIHVLDVYEVNESISMKIGNIDFPGSVVIRGDVPTGFTVKAEGDIRIFGLVEAATIIAKGSVTVSEGIAGLKIGRIEAGEDVHIGYVNQGIIKAGNNIYVENSIMHSECTAINDIILRRGNIVGGIISAGGAIIANNVGNRMNTKTNLSFGMDYKLFERQKELQEQLAKLENNRQKLRMLQSRFAGTDKEQLDSKSRITLLRLKYSLEKTNEEIEAVKNELAEINATLGSVDRAYLKVKGTIFPNVTVSFGKYERKIEKEYDNVMIVNDNNEIVIRF